MIAVELFSWWYVKGWGVFIGKLRRSLGNILDFFSMSSLIRTLFQPFRQISAETAVGTVSIDRKFQMFIDRLISRVIGFFSRLVLLIVGSVIILVGAVCSLVLIVLWPIVPLCPIIGIALAVMGVLV